MEFPVRTFRLASHPNECGLWCGVDGLKLAGQPLLKLDGLRFRPASLNDVQNVLDRVFENEPHLDAKDLLPGLSSIARSLNKGDVALAQIGSVLLKLPEVPDSRTIDWKLGYDDTEARDDIGRWTSGGGTTARSPAAVAAEEAAASETATATEVTATKVTATELLPETVSLLARLARILPGPVSLAAGLLIPTNESNIHYGQFPEFPDLHYRSDEGVLTISRLGADGNIEALYHGTPDANGFYRDDQGLIIGRHVGTAVLFDNESLSDLSVVSPRETTTDKPPNTSTESEKLPEDTEEMDDNDPKACPPPTPEETAGRSKRALAYQRQITGLPEGWDVVYNGIRYDGCEPVSNDMQEAKGIMGGYLIRLSDEQLKQTKFYSKIMWQAERQSRAAADRYVDWYFTEKRFADFFATKFAQYPNIRVHQFDAIVTKFINWIAALASCRTDCASQAIH